MTGIRKPTPAIKDGVPVHVEGRGGLFGGGKSGGGLSGGGTQAPNTLQNISYALIVDLISEGQILGFYEGVDTALGGGGGNYWQSIYYNNTPVMGPNGVFNYPGITQSGFTLGTADQNPLPGFNAAASETQVNIEIQESTGPHVETIEDPTVTAVSVTIEVPALYHYFTSNGDVNDDSLSLAIEIAGADGVYTTVVSDVISGKCTSPYERTYMIGLSTFTAPYSVRVSRTSPDSTDTNEVNAFYWASYTEIIQGNFMYPNCALFGISLDAQEFGSSVPTRSYDVLGVVVSVPSNYDSGTRTYTGVWDGTFQTAWTNNPVWVLLDLLINPRYGLGQKIGIDNVDIGSFYQAAQYCDEYIDDGFGGYEPRWTFNGVILQQQDAYKVLQTVAASFRGILFWTAGTVFLRADMPLDPVALVAPANVIDSKFTYSGSALKARHTVALVTWKDPALNFDDSVEYVQDDAGLQTYGYRPIQVVAFGCTSRGQAHRIGLWILDTEKTQTETVIYQCSFDQAQLKPGDVVAIADPAYSGVRFGGRIVSYTAGIASDTIELDSAILMDGGQSYNFQCVFPDGTVSPLTEIITPPGPNQTIELATHLTQAPVNGAMWVVTGSDVAPRQFQVQSLREVSKGIFEITALFYDPTKYARVEDGITMQPPSYTRYPTGPCDPPTNLNVIESLYYSNGQPTNRLTFGWSASGDILAFQYAVSYLDPSGQNHVLPPTQQLTVSVAPAALGEFTFSVYCITSDGRNSAVESITFDCDGKTTPPDPITDLTATPGLSSVSLSWLNPTDPDLLGVNIWMGTTSVFANATELGSSGGTNYTVTGLADGTTYYFWAQDEDTSGNLGDLVGPVSASTAQVLANQIANALLTTAAFAQGIKVPALEATLPNPATWGGSSLVYLETTGELYELNPGPPASWQQAYGGLSSLYTDAFALGINIPAVVSTLPATGTEGQTVTLTTDGQLYRYHSGAWTAEVPGSGITPGSITTTQIAPGSITTPLIAANAVNTAQLAADAVTAAQIAANTITAAQIAAGAIGAAEIAANSITAGQIAAGAIGAAEIAAGAILGTNIAGSTITGSNIAANTIDCSSLKSSTITASDIYLSQSGTTVFDIHAADDGNGYGPYLKVTDGTYNRIMIGRVNNDYGIEIRDSSGNLVVDANGTLGVDVVGGTQLKNAAVDTPNMVTGAITGIGQNTGSTGTSGNSFVTVCTVTITVQGYAQILWGSAATSANSTNDIQFALVVDGTQVLVSTLQSGSGYAASWSVTGLTTNTAHTFELQVASASGHAIGYTNPNLVVLDAKA